MEKVKPCGNTARGSDGLPVVIQGAGSDPVDETQAEESGSHLSASDRRRLLRIRPFRHCYGMEQVK